MNLNSNEALTKVLRAENFMWASGIEDTFVPQVKPGQRTLDEYQLMGHYEHWRDDLALARELGVQALRWGVPWYRVEPLPGEFDWRWTDQVIPYMVNDLGITPIIDLMHYGCPFWLYREFANPTYPERVAAYAAAFAQRYGGLVKWYTPLNEPYVNAWMCGKRGLWPPYLRGDRGLFFMMIQLARGIIQTVEAVKALDPESVMVHVEATGIFRTLTNAAQAQTDQENALRFLVYDLITSRVTPDHSLYLALIAHGITPKALAEIAEKPIALDVLGLNFYPQWGTKQISLDGRGRSIFRNIEKGGDGFAKLIEDHYQRYHAPIMITETSAHGKPEGRAKWLQTSVSTIKNLRQNGVPVLGYTWFPMFTMINWRYRFGQLPPEHYRLDLGLYRLDEGNPRWQATALVDQYRDMIAHPMEAVGAFAG